MDKTTNLVRGYTWVSSRGASACKKCAALHGHQFYFKPKPGQLAVADMPMPPLHPNCRCKLIEIVDVLGAARAIDENSIYDRPTGVAGPGPVNDLNPQDTTNYDTWLEETRPINFYRVGRDNIKGGRTFLKVIWENNGRSFWDGPVYANYGGGNWEAGRNPHLVNEPVNTDPEDDMDACFAQHDVCYDMFDEYRCDRELIRNLEALAEDPRMWRNPPRDKPSIEYARRYRAYAITLFKGKAYIMQNEHTRYGDELVISN